MARKAIATRFQNEIHALVTSLEQLASERCEVRDTNGVHWLVSEARKLQTLEHRLRMRFPPNNGYEDNYEA